MDTQNIKRNNCQTEEQFQRDKNTHFRFNFLGLLELTIKNALYLSTVLEKHVPVG